MLLAGCYALRRPILYLFGASEASFVYADAHLKIYLCGTPFSMLATGFNSYISARGFPRTGMRTTVIGALLNVLLDLLFIFVLDLGVQGAAAATVISQLVSVAWVLWFLTGRRAIVRLRCERIRVECGQLGKIVAQGANGLVQIVCNNQLQICGGDLYVVIMAIVSSVREIVSVPILGFSHGTQPILGFNYGADRNDRVREGGRFLTVGGMAYLLAAWVLIMLIPQQLIGLFSDDTETTTRGAAMLNLYFFGFVFMGLQFAGQSTFQVLGKERRAIFSHCCARRLLWCR